MMMTTFSPFWNHFVRCDHIYYGNFGSQRSKVLFAVSCTSTFTEMHDAQRLKSKFTRGTIWCGKSIRFIEKWFSPLKVHGLF